MGEKEIIKIPQIILQWSKWYPWKDVEKGARKSEIKIPNKKPGVYEVKYKCDDKRLTIGKASDLRMRIRQGLVKGKIPHSAGKKIRKNEETSKIVIRWTITDRPAAEKKNFTDDIKKNLGNSRNM